MNKKTKKFIDEIISECWEYLQHINDTDCKVELTFFTVHDMISSDYMIDANFLDIPNYSMWTCMEGVPLDDSSDIIKEIIGEIYMAYEDLYLLIIELGMDRNKIMESMKFNLRHELGHVISYNNILRGKTLDDFEEIHMEYERDVSNMKRPRKNASFDSRFKWWLNYHTNIHLEKLANDVVGITEQDLIDEFHRTNC